MIHVVTIDQYLQQLQQGSEAGLRYFMSKYTKPLRFFAFSILRDKEVAKEIVSDSFFKLWNGRGKVRSEDSVKAFLYIATRNACYNHLASSETKRKSDQELEEDILKGIVAPGADILTSIIHTELVQQVAALVDQLTEQQAKVFRMSFFDDLSTEEICEELGTTARYAGRSVLR